MIGAAGLVRWLDTTQGILASWAAVSLLVASVMRLWEPPVRVLLVAGGVGAFATVLDVALWFRLWADEAEVVPDE